MSNMEDAQSRRSPGSTPSERESGASVATEPSPLRGTQTLERLRERVEAVARELIRLRQQNAELVRRLAELEARPLAEEDAVALEMDQDAEALRARIDGFVQAVDYYLSQEDAVESGE